MNPLELPKNCKPCIRVDTNDQSVGYSVGLPLGIRQILDKYSFEYSFQLMCDLQDNLDYSWALFVDSIYCNPAMFPTEMNNQTFVSVMHIDTTEEEFTSNDVNRLPDDVREVLDGCEWYYDDELPKRLAPFVSPTFRLVVDGEEYEALETNEKGGKQSVIQGRYDLLPAPAVEDIAVILGLRTTWHDAAIGQVVALQERLDELHLVHGKVLKERDTLSAKYNFIKDTLQTVIENE